jgi:hypothetical protein
LPSWWPLSRSARSAKGGADRSEFALQYAGEIRDDKDQSADDKAEEHHIFRHRRAVFVVSHCLEQLPNLRHDSTPYDCFGRDLFNATVVGTAVFDMSLFFDMFCFDMTASTVSLLPTQHRDLRPPPYVIAGSRSGPSKFG